MRILADENCDRHLVSELRQRGHDLLYVTEFARGAGDAALFEQAALDGRLLLTNDLDFGLLAERAENRPPGIVLLRLHPLPAAERAAIAASFFEKVGSDWRGCFFVVESGSVRRRHLL